MQIHAQTGKRPAAGWRDYMLLLLISFLFGSSFTLTSLAVREVPPLTVVAARLLIAMVIFIALIVFARQKLPRGKIWWWIVAAAFFGNALPFCLINWAQVRVDAGLTAIYMAIMPLGTVLIAHFVTDDEKLNALKLTGVFAGILGVAVLMGWGQVVQMGGNLLRELAILAAALCYSANAIITRNLVKLPKRSLLAALMFASVAMVLPLAIVFDRPWEIRPSATALLCIFTLGVGSTAIATLLLVQIVARQGASFLSQLNFILPIIGATLGLVVLDERLQPNAWIALVLVLCGIALLHFGSKKWIAESEQQ